MDDPLQTSVPETLAPRLMSLANGYRTTQALYVAAKLGIPDQLASGPQSSEALAQILGAHPASLYRLLRALTTIEVVQEREDGRFELLPIGSLLRSDSPASLRSWALFGGHQWQVWGDLLTSIQTGESARKRLFGTDGFEHVEQDPELAAVFNQAMVELTRLVSGAVARAYDFSNRRILDVGGGYGELLRAILAAHSTARGVLFDMPHAMEEGRRNLEEAGFRNRCEFVSGDFFESVPIGADTYILKSIIHDWNDEKATAILGACRQAMTPEARLLLVERILPERLGTTPADQTVAFSDLNMLLSHQALERTEADFRRLLENARLRLRQIIPVTSGFSILEATV
jgi:hypothetical protein